jgi:hypothetical protein
VGIRTGLDAVPARCTGSVELGRVITINITTSSTFGDLHRHINQTD